MKPQWTGALALAASAVAAVVLAHTGATGIVLDRMNGMTAMRDTVAELAPMMQGTVPNDTFLVSEGASVTSGQPKCPSRFRTGGLMFRSMCSGTRTFALKSSSCPTRSHTPACGQM